MTAPDCSCGHPAEHHQHYRGGSDCGECGPAVCHVYVPADLEPLAADLIRALNPYSVPREDHLMADPNTDPGSPALEDPPAETAGEQDHTDPWAMAGDDADAPTDPAGGA